MSRKSNQVHSTPLDAATRGLKISCVELLLSSSVPVLGSSIVEAIQQDAVDILKVFYRHNPHFTKEFSTNTPRRGINPLLNRWELCFTALNYALALDSNACAKFLLEIGQKKTKKYATCRRGHFAPWISEESFVTNGGVNMDGLTEVVSGYYCIQCEKFIRGQAILETAPPHQF